MVERSLARTSSRDTQSVVTSRRSDLHQVAGDVGQHAGAHLGDG